MKLFTMNRPTHLRHVLATIAVMLVVSPQHLFAQTEVQAVLAGHAFVPASTTVAPPADAGPLFATAGKFTAGDCLSLIHI